MPNALVADTQAVVWYLTGSDRLSTTARDTMREAAAAAAPMYVSAITLVELVYLTERARIPEAALTRLEERLADAAAPFQLAPVDGQVVAALKQVPRDEVPDMPDRIIAATAVALGVPLVTADGKLQAAEVVDTVW